jgi:hypothetical protein
MSEFLRANTRLKIAGLASLAGASALLASGCGGSGADKLAVAKSIEPQTCMPKDPVSWESTPPDVRMKLVAGILKVSQDQVAAGSMGLADCRRAVSVDHLGEEIVSVLGFGERCLPVATTDENGQTLPLNKPSLHISVLCAADGPSI